MAKAIQEGKADKGILICGTGQGMAIVANKHKGVYACVVDDLFSGERAKIVNNANVITMGGWITAPFLGTPDRRRLAGHGLHPEDGVQEGLPDERLQQGRGARGGGVQVSVRYEVPDTEDGRAVAALVARARAAQAVAAGWDQARVDEVCVAVGWSVYNDENIARLARAAVDETGMGVYEDKLIKHKNKVLGVLRDIRDAKSVGLIEGTSRGASASTPSPSASSALWRP